MTWTDALDLAGVLRCPEAWLRHVYEHFERRLHGHHGRLVLASPQGV